MKTKITLIGLLFFLSCSTVEKLERKADKGDLSSCYDLVELYSSCDYYTTDRKMQEKLYKYSEKGISIAIDTNIYDQNIFYGKFYRELAKSAFTAKRLKYAYYLKAAKFEDNESQWVIGLYYLEGRDGQIQNDSAIYWIEKASKYSAIASTKMGDIYSDGILVKADTSKAIYYYKKSCACYKESSDLLACEKVISFYKNQKKLKDTTELAIYSELARQLRKHNNIR